MRLAEDRRMHPEARQLIAQHLEGGIGLHRLAVSEAVEPLRAAHDAGVTDVCIGWQLPNRLLDAVFSWRDNEAADVRLHLWHPLLAGDGVWAPGDDGAVGPRGNVVPPARGMAEFSFACPARPGVRPAAMQRLARELDKADWDGVLLDKIRWPSPSHDPVEQLACFCDACRQHSAERAGLDLNATAECIRQLDSTRAGREQLLRALFGVHSLPEIDGFLTWRMALIEETVREAVDLAHRRHLRVGLDVFSPSLACLVGQPIGALAKLADWTKAMCYVATFAPAGLPYELLGLVQWLEAAGATDPLTLIEHAVGFPVPDSQSLRRHGLDVRALAIEVNRLSDLAGDRAAVGLEFVEIPGVCELNDRDLGERAQFVVQAGLPLVISWDLMHVPRRRLPMAGK